MPRGQPGTGTNTTYARYLQVKGAAAELHELHGKIRRLITMFPELADGRLPGDVEMEPATPPPKPSHNPLKTDPKTQSGKLRGHPELTNRGTPRIRKAWSDEARANMSRVMKKRHKTLRKNLPKGAKLSAAEAQKQARLEYEAQRAVEESGKE